MHASSTPRSGARESTRSADTGASPADNMFLAAKSGSVSRLQVLLSSDPLFNVNMMDGLGYTPLMWAAYYAHDEALTLLLEAGANVNISSSGGFTALHIAAGRGATAILERLLLAGANVDAATDLGSSCLHEAASLNSRSATACVSRLVYYTQLISVKCRLGRTPLHVACASGSRQTVDTLLRNNANVNEADNAGMTPLHYAASSRASDVALLQVLLSHGANLDCVDVAGCSAQHYARAMGHWDMAQFLDEARTLIVPPVHRDESHVLPEGNRGMPDTTDNLTQRTQLLDARRSPHRRDTELDVQVSALTTEIETLHTTVATQNEELSRTRASLDHLRGQNLQHLTRTGLETLEDALHKSLVLVSKAKIHRVEMDSRKDAEEGAKMKAAMVAMEESRLCKICLEEEQNVLLLPCAHLCLCSGCVVEIAGGPSPKCPICRETIVRHTLCYFS
eukprot:TRINITY_DN11302_c0_g1_i9.p1 TRINITY_DN11302_c0_g1~~TRINITY_DN11302_c0_g1_i9.p1  ORF type:complete len:473 (-),score=86.49 TRINITY_DN11302_c0_g1_i9:675-2027(-)